MSPLIVPHNVIKEINDFNFLNDFKVERSSHARYICTVRSQICVDAEKNYMSAEYIIYDKYSHHEMVNSAIWCCKTCFPLVMYTIRNMIERR